MTIYSNKLNVSVSHCSCPTGEVCANPDGSCPANSFPDNYYLGCCIPCNQLIPANVSVNVPNTNLYYIVNHTLNNYGFLPYAPSTGGCNQACGVTQESTGPPPCYFFDFVVSGRVTDSAGHGICNQKVYIHPEQTYYEVSVGYTEVFGFPEMITVYWAIYTGSGETVTDSNGNFSLNISAWAYPYATTTNLSAFPYCYNGNLVTQPVTIVVEVKGTVISNIGIGDIYLNTWDNGGYILW
jgi:hypothetical protein